MRRVRRLFVLLFIALASSHGWEPSLFAAAPHDNVLSIIDDQTIVVIDINKSRLTSESLELIQSNLEWLPRQARLPVQRVLVHPKINRFFAVISLADKIDDMPILAFTLPPEEDLASLARGDTYVLESVGELRILGTANAVKRCAAITKNTQQQRFETALRQFVDSPCRLAFALGPDQQRVVSKWGLPPLGSGVSKRRVSGPMPLIASLDWATFSFEDSDDRRLGLLTKQSDSAAVDSLWDSLPENMPRFLENETLNRLQSPPDQLAAELTIDSDGFAQRVKAWTKASYRTITKSRLGRLSLALHNYNSAFRRVPPPSIQDANGNPLLSWRVAVLPFLGKQEANLYHRFHRDEPWDSPHNKSLIREMPDAFRTPGSNPAEFKSSVEAPIGPKRYFRDKVITLDDATDGLKHTLVLMHVPDKHNQTWTKPDQSTIDLATRMRQSAKGTGDQCLVVRAWGDVRSLDVRKYGDEIPALLTTDGGETTTFTAEAAAK